ncbi:hypothetical protein Vadar_007341 [Vaccinium darrowii]|uniref:Uncharacterized protein n=1 Tax=Vaccinium darrowii TaxID=229202 RepID=A0ACB7XXE0_9ERIC|nr:hypothetical protein Vadar_007341 [Vaccinium darrowii]
MARLPEDVSTEILSRLPLKSLLRFKSACKTWRDLIQNPNFISLHHNRSTKNDDCLLVKRFLSDDIRDSVFSLVSDEKAPVCDLVDLFSATGANVWDLDLLGSCNGVVCIASKSASNCKSTITLCNPSMREIRLVPQPCYHTRPWTVLGFGFDSNANDYKVVRITTVYEFDIKPYEFLDPYAYDTGVIAPNIMPVDVKVEIYNMSSDCWREIDTVVPRDFQCSPHPNFCASLNGVSYWLAYNYGYPCRKAIIGFRMSEELFEQIPLPQEIPLPSWFNLNLFALSGSLAFVFIPNVWVSYRMSEASVFDIWVMDGYGVEGSWNKKYTIGPLFDGHLYPLLCRKNGELLLLRCRDKRMVSYDPITGILMEYQGIRSAYCVWGLQVLPYTESLVSVKRRIDRDSFPSIQSPLKQI